MKAWHFTNGTLRDGRPIPPVGETLRHDHALVMCKSGLHASKRLINALRYAPGETLHRVELSGTMIHDDDKIVAMERTILWTVPENVMEPLLRDFARRCALDVIHLWGAPDVVREYLETGREDLRDAARAAATWQAAWAGTRAASWTAARDAASAAARGVAWAAARDAASAAARGVAQGTARTAAWDAAWDKQNRRLTSMVVAARKQLDQEDE